MASDFDDTLNRFIGEGTPIEVSDGTCLFQPGDQSQAFLIVVDGTVRVEQTNTAGRTIVLYRVEAGESCMLTTTCLLSDRTYPGYGYAEGNVKAVAIGADRFQALIASDTQFQTVVFRGFATRVSGLTDVIDDLLLYRTDLKLARWLARQSESAVDRTQQEIAQEIGTAREVVSRTLKSFEERGWILLKRGAVELLDVDALEAHGNSNEM